MKQFKTVLKFEYFNYLRSKTFVGITIFFIVIIGIVSFLPQIQNGLSGIFGSDSSEEQVDLLSAAFYDESDIYSSEILTAYAPGYEWTQLDNTVNVKKVIEDGTYGLAVIIDGLNVDIYEAGSDSMYSNNAPAITEAVKAVYQATYLANSGLASNEISDVLAAAPIVNTISVGRDSSQSFWLSYAVLFILYFSLVYYGASIGTAVVTEKTSKAMELLVTSARPMSLMFGKVFGVGLAGLSQLGLIIIVALLAINLNLDKWTEAYPIVGAILETSLSANVLIYAIVFFLLGFFSYAFIYAALASTASRVEDASSVTSVPTMLVVISFLVAMMGLTSPDAFYLQVLSFVPFISPMVMFMRICLLEIPTWQILACIGANILYIFIFGFISARIYRVGIMLYGNKAKFKDLLSYIKG